MNQKIIPIVSIVVGVIAFFLTTHYLGMKEGEIDEMRKKMEQRMTQVTVMVATKDIPQGKRISATDMGKLQQFQTLVPRDAVSFGNEAKMILGRKTLFKLKRGQILTWADIEGGTPEQQGLAPTITEGLRAISLSVGGAAAVSSMVRPNDRIDVLGTFNFPSKTVPGEMETVTLTILQDVTVLATGQTLAKQRISDRGRSQSASYSTVTLEVTPSESELLVFAQQMRGRLTLTLRHPNDNRYKKDMPVIDFKYLQTELERLNLYRQTNIRKNSPIRSR